MKFNRNFSENALIKLLLENSLKISPKDTLIVDYQNHAYSLLEKIKEKAKSERFALKEFCRPPFISISELQKLDNLIDGTTAYLKIGGGEYKISYKEKKDIEKLEGIIRNKRCKSKWITTQYPSKYLSNKLNIPFKKLEDLYFSCCFVDYSEQRKTQEKIVQQFKSGMIYIESPNTKIMFSIREKPHLCNGEINMPDGEIFYEINPFETEGEIRFTIPTIFGFAHFKDVWLKFHKGKVVNYDSNQNKKLNILLNLDDGAKYMGEFGIGTNPKAKIVGNSFYDEKVRGTFHLALGAMDSRLESVLHMDLVKKADDCKIINNDKLIKLF